VRNRRAVITLLALGLLLALTFVFAEAAAPPAVPSQNDAIQGPFSDQPVYPTVWNGDLRDLPQIGEGTEEGDPPDLMPARLTPAEIASGMAAAMVNNHAGTDSAGNGPISGPMPSPIANFAGMNLSANGDGWPPDTNGDVGTTYYIQTVNTSVGIYNKSTGAQVSAVSFDTFFQGPAATPCDTSNDGDPVVLYDAMADRWIVTDFAWFSFNTGPYYECIAVSQTNDPVAGGWYFYAMQANTGTFATHFNDYPKLGVWPDAYYMSANMFQATGSGFGVRLWALDRASILAGGPLNEVHFDLCTDGSCGSFLPSNLRGTPPPAGSPNYFMTAGAPDSLDIYEFHVDWTTPANSTLTGPTSVPVSPFVIQNDGVPQLGTGTLLDSLSFRLMMQLQYRNMGSYETLWANHTIDVNGKAIARWYEVRDPGGTPTLFQEGELELADGAHRWMGSIAADQDGNAAIGYSVSSSTMYPAIRYSGRRAGEYPGQLPQTETSLIDGAGSQTGISRWGDYSAMSVDPTDDCTFWYTNEYYVATGSNWQTRIGSFKFPSCGQTLGTLDGNVYNTITLAGVPGAPVTLEGPESVTVVTDANGDYTMDVLPGTYTITAGPLLPGYPTAATATNVVVGAGGTTTTDIGLDPVPNLVFDAYLVDDSPSGGNNNGYPEPGETGVLLYVDLFNDGADTATGISALLSSPTAGVTVTQNSSDYPDIAAGNVAPNDTAYEIDLDSGLPCGEILAFEVAVASDQGPYTLTFTIQASIPQAPTSIFFDDFEAGVNGWTTGGSNNTWAQTTEAANSPTHSWTDSPGGNYVDNTNSWLQAPSFDLAGKTGVVVSSYNIFDLESGFDYVYLEYSTNGGSSWSPLASYNGSQGAWQASVVDASAVDNQANVLFRYRLNSDGGVVADGIHIDDFDVSYTPIVCEPPPAPEDYLIYLPMVFLP